MFNWSASRINSFNYCRRRFFLNYILKDKALNLSVYRRGTLVHELIENFWKKLGSPEEIKQNKKGKVVSEKKYSNSEQFLSYAQGQWMYKVFGDKHAGREIDWRFEGEEWMIRNSYLPSICPGLFEKLCQEGPPIESELHFEFILNGRGFNGYIDEVRTRDGFVVVRDYKTEQPWMGNEKLSGNPQLTLYCVAIGALANKSSEFARRIGLEGEADKLFGNPKFISEKVRPEFFMVDFFTKNPEKVRTMPELIHSTTRSESDFEELIMNVEAIEKEIKQYRKGEKKNIPPTERGAKCDYCDVKKACLKRRDEEIAFRLNGSDEERQGCLFPDLVSPYSMKKRKSLSPVQRRFKWKKRS